MNDPLHIIGFIAAIGVIIYWAVSIIRGLAKDEPNDEPWSLDDRDVKNEL